MSSRTNVVGKLLRALFARAFLRTSSTIHAASARSGFQAFRKMVELRCNDVSRPLVFVAIAEIDRFNHLRRQIGYEVSSDLIAALAKRLKQRMTDCEIGRVGRNSIEFAFADVSLALAEARLQALIVDLEDDIDIHGYQFQLSVTIGGVELEDQPLNDQLLDHVFAAVAEARDNREKVRLTKVGSEDTELRGPLIMMRDLREAMVSGGLELQYQPKLRARTNTIESAEALLRWTHPEQGMVPTDRLIAVAEASGAIRDLSRWVIERAIEDQARLAAAGKSLTLFVNVSGLLIADKGFAQWAIERLSGQTGKFGFEITETAVIDDPDDALANLKLFHEAGIKIAIDDYGSGLSSLAYLKQLPAHELKIDRMFISGLTDSHRDPLLVRSSIDLAHALEMEVTAEGVDDVMSLSLLRIMGCDMIQGYLISRPLPLPALVDFLNDAAGLDPISAPIVNLADWQPADPIVRVETQKQS
jgi:EAL domain-containing protein (putative c-di-GMP-specific phosphodiesterase class I)/GGDEF domain-containing protein